LRLLCPLPPPARFFSFSIKKKQAWVEDPAQWPALRSAFEGTTAFGQLRAAHCTVAGRNVFVRFVCFAGDAMGMNMVSKVLY
jgi:hydroxymethylglutaryl-CoA reductase (NADPH)